MVQMGVSLGSKKGLSYLAAAALVIALTGALSASIFWREFSASGGTGEANETVNIGHCDTDNILQIYEKCGKKLTYYGYYYVESNRWNLSYFDEIKDYTNIIQLDYFQANLTGDFSRKLKENNVKVSLFLSFFSGNLLTNKEQRRNFLVNARKKLIESGLYQQIAYIKIFDESYLLAEHGSHTDIFTFFTNRTRDERILLMKELLEDVAEDVHDIFPGIPVGSVENGGDDIFEKNPDGSFRYPAPDNFDFISIDPYFHPDSLECDAAQRAKFESKMQPAIEWAKSRNIPVELIGESFRYKHRKYMPSSCQMQWYYETAENPENNVVSLLWFSYGTALNFEGVREYGDRINYQQEIGKEITGKR